MVHVILALVRKRQGNGENKASLNYIMSSGYMFWLLGYLHKSLNLNPHPLKTNKQKSQSSSNMLMTERR